MGKLVAENIFSFDAKFWLRIATRADSAPSQVGASGGQSDGGLHGGGVVGRCGRGHLAVHCLNLKRRPHPTPAKAALDNLCGRSVMGFALNTRSLSMPSTVDPPYSPAQSYGNPLYTPLLYIQYDQAATRRPITTLYNLSYSIFCMTRLIRTSWGTWLIM